MDDDQEDLPRVQFAELPKIDSFNNYDWNYSMRRQMQEIVPRVFLGPYAVATKKKLCYLQEYHITHIVCIRHPLEARTIRANFPELIRYMVIDFDENFGHIIPYFSQVKEFVDSCLKTEGCVLIHGNAGISSSATLVIAYVMETYGLGYNEAYQLVQNIRCCISPSNNCKRQLLEYEAIHLAKRQAETGATQGPKRMRGEVEEDASFTFPSKATKR